MDKALLLLLLALNISSCLYTEENNYNGESPSYKMKELKNGKQIVIKRRFFWVKNYWNNEKKLDVLVLKLMCESLVDSIEITNIELDFATGGSKWDIKPLESYKWNIIEPNVIEKGMKNYIPFECNVDQ